MLIVLFLVLFFGLLAVGMPIFLVLGLCAAVLYFASGEPLIGVAQVIIDHLNSPTLMSLPLFVMAATFMRHGGVAKALVDLSAAWLGGIRGRSGWLRWWRARCLQRSPARRSRPRSRWERSCCRP
jgi:C4-dicarboxylate transporter, DctM subunit